MGCSETTTFRQANNVWGLLRDMPIEHIGVETDAPDIPPRFHGTMGSRARNAPVHVAPIGAMLAEVRGMSLEAFAGATTGNVRKTLAREPT